MGAGLGDTTALITDGRFSGASRGFIIGDVEVQDSQASILTHGHSGHVVPEARLGGPIALVKDGDKIIVDADNRSIDWLVDEAEQARRKKEWEASDKGEFREKRGVLFRYARDVAVSVLSLITVCVRRLMRYPACKCGRVLRLMEGWVAGYEKISCS